MHTRAQLKSLPKPRWLVQDVLVERTVAVLFGPSGVGKSFVAIDLACSLATGTDWHGRRVLPDAAVYYVFTEGLHDTADVRISAWERVHGRVPDDRFLSTDSPISLNDGDSVSAHIDAIKTAPRPIKLVVVDTLAKAAVGADENEVKEMGVVLAGAQRIAEETGACVVLVHHAGHAGNRERGSSCLRAAVNTSLQVQENGGGIAVSCEKQKSAMPFATIPFHLVSARGSLVLELCDAKNGTASHHRHEGGAARRTRGKKKGPTVKEQVLAVLVEACRPLTRDEWLAECVARGLNRGSATTIVSTLKREGVVEQDGHRGPFRVVNK